LAFLLLFDCAQEHLMEKEGSTHCLLGKLQ